MDFLNKLYESNYFGIGLFCVIAFLVVAFLIVLFFGKKDEKKRKLEETKQLETINNNENAFKETSEATPIEVPNVAQAMPTPLEPVAPVNYEVPNDSEFVQNLNIEGQPIIAPVIPTSKSVVEPVRPIINEEIKPIINEPIAPVVEPTIVKPEPTILEPITINIPEEPLSNETVINTPLTPDVMPVVEPTPIVEPVIPPTVDFEPVIEDTAINNDTYYKPIEKVEAQPIDVPNIDFDAIAKSISKELDDLEKNSANANVEVTPIDEIKPSNGFSSIYVEQPKAPEQPVSPTPTVMPKTKFELPKKIDLPSMKTEEETEKIEPESYTI